MMTKVGNCNSPNVNDAADFSSQNKKLLDYNWNINNEDN